MKIIRSAKCSLKFSTAHKKQQLGTILSEYGKVVNIFIRAFWSLGELPTHSIADGMGFEFHSIMLTVFKEERSLI